MRAKIQADIKLALKARDKIRTETLRSVLAAFQYEEMSKEVDTLSEQDTIAVLKREVKKREEELEFAEKADRSELVDNLNSEIAVVNSYLPSQFKPRTTTNDYKKISLKERPSRTLERL